MTPAPRLVAAAALAALLLPACVSETKRPGEAREWSLTADQPEVFVAGGEADDPSGDAPAGGTPDDGAPVVAVDASGDDDEDLLSLITPATAEDALAGVIDDRSEIFSRLGRDVVRGIDGTWSKVYTLRAGNGAKIVKLLQTTVPGFPQNENEVGGPNPEAGQAIRYVLHTDFYADQTEGFGIRPAITGTKVGDVLVVTAPPEILLYVDELLHKLIADVPQIEIEVRVVEINLDDLLDWDSKLQAFRLEDRDAAFDPTTNPPSGGFGSGLPIFDDIDLDGTTDVTGAGAAFSSFATPSSVTGFLLSLQGVHNGLRVDALLSFLQTIGASELISAPTVTVLNGHRARLTTGDRVPVFQASGVGTNAQVTTIFEDTGVTVELVPFIVGDDVIRIDVSVDVSAVTGEEPFVLSGVEVSTPIISQREAGTTVHVHSGQVFSIGGLRQSTDIETITKVPFLGDIPLLGWLFKSRASRETNTEIVFFITPRIKLPSETLLEPIAD